VGDEGREDERGRPGELLRHGNSTSHLLLRPDGVAGRCVVRALARVRAARRDTVSLPAPAHLSRARTLFHTFVLDGAVNDCGNCVEPRPGDA